jgi:hypothetical protein
MKKLVVPALLLVSLTGASGCTSVMQGKSTFTVHCQTFLGIGCGFEDAEEAIPAGGKITNVNHSAFLFGLFKHSVIGGTK